MRSLFVDLALRDFRSKYAGSVMGAVWALANPLLLLAVFTFVFTVIFKIRFGASTGIGHNALYIFCGILPWIAFQDGVARATSSLVTQKNLVTRVRFPAAALPTSTVGSSLLGMAAGLVVLIAASVAVEGRVHPEIVYLPVIVALQFAFTLGVALLFSSVNVFFRDLEHLMPVGLMAWMYCTPIFYSPAMIQSAGDIDIAGHTITAADLSAIMSLNPMAHVVEAYRAVTLEGRLPIDETAHMAFFACLSMAVGMATFSRLKARFADVL